MAKGEKMIADNRRARYEYELLERFEAGIVLTGTEVKSLRAAGGVTIARAYADVRGDEVWLLGATIPEYRGGNRQNHEPDRPRKLLLHKREIAKFAGKASEQGYTLVPLRLYFKQGRAKVELAVARGKKLHDKRETQKKAEAQREIRGAMRSRRN